MKTLRDVPVGGNAKVVKLHGEGAVRWNKRAEALLFCPTR